jgi:hypothetical protein
LYKFVQEGVQTFPVYFARGEWHETERLCFISETGRADRPVNSALPHRPAPDESRTASGCEWLQDRGVNLYRNIPVNQLNRKHEAGAIIFLY